MFPEGQAMAFYEHIFRTFDEDDSGQIDFTEFLQVCQGFLANLRNRYVCMYPQNTKQSFQNDSSVTIVMIYLLKVKF